MAEEILVVNEVRPYVAVLTATSSPVAGPQGTAGVTGEQGFGILGGVGAPSAGIGRNGDYYIDDSTTAPMLYGPKAAGVWPAGRALRGPTGTQGIQGIQGIQGLKGDTGAAGTVTFAGTGIATTASRSDHNHQAVEKIVTGTGVYGGTAKPANAALIRQAGTFVGTVSGATGNLSIPLPQAFPGGMVTALVSPGDTANSLGMCIVNATSTTLSTLVVVCRRTDGTYVPASGSVRVNYNALGW